MTRDVSLNTLKVNTKVVTVEIHDVEFQQFQLRNDNGTCHLNFFKKTGNIDIQSFVGMIQLSLHEIGNSIKVHGGNRGAIIHIPANAPVQISGDQKCTVVAKTNNGSHSMNLKSRVGRIKVLNH